MIDVHRPSALGRYQPLAWLLICFLGVSMLTRIALWTTVTSAVPLAALLRACALGLGYDLATFVYFAWPLVLLLWLLPMRWMGKRLARGLVGALCLLLLGVLLFVAVAEWTFWDEFRARFNFIAVDYLVYTNEVVGNIRQSYPVGWILSAMALVCIALFVATRRWRRPRSVGPRWLARSGITLGWLALTVLLAWTVRGDAKDGSGNTYADELAGNGIHQFFAAYRSASLDYARYYRTLPPAQAHALLRNALATPDARFLTDDANDLRRIIRNPAPQRRLNVVLVSVESLSADYSGLYGANPSLTPHLDALTPHSLVFDRLYATGTRTVRGLEALALSVPPTPGESIVKRPGNTGLFSLASVFNAKGYRSLFLYGGYGSFDNMNAFFSGNGYEVHDRRDIDSASIHHENIWGVADEDLYTMSMAQMDRAHAEGKPFFAHIMTTSNHRPYTFPEGRGPWPQGKRESAVAYTDWAIGDFLKRAKHKPWFADTVFVLTADHCASSGGISALPIFRFRIPIWIYAPGHVQPQRIDRMISQIDIAPTLLGLLGFDYVSQFYGRDVLQPGDAPQRAFIATYQLMGYLTPKQLVQLGPNRFADAVLPTGIDHDAVQPATPVDPQLLEIATAYYQGAAYAFRDGRMRDRSSLLPLPQED